MILPSYGICYKKVIIVNAWKFVPQTLNKNILIAQLETLIFQKTNKRTITHTILEAGNLEDG